MRIAFISHEFPPDTGGGGIGTYLAQVTSWLAAEGHHVEVFCGAGNTAGFTLQPNRVGVHRITGEGAVEFRHAVVPVFAAAHQAGPFDVIEGNDFDAPALVIKQTFPQLPYVVKLHTPRFVIDQLHQRPLTIAQHWRMRLGALRRGRWLVAPRPIISLPPAQAEISAVELADEIAAPSQAIADAALNWTAEAAGKISVFPYPYVPAPELLALSPTSDPSPPRVTFVGRLEERKGVIDLADAIPLVLAVCPDARFRFIGRAMPSPVAGLDMSAFLEKRLGSARARVEFTGPIPPTELPRYLGETAVLVAPSHWESFGLVCCEGLAAACAVIGSANGGMIEILDGGNCGVLVPPKNPAVLAQAIVRLLCDPTLRDQLGAAGRRRINDHYTWNQVRPAQLASYERAIQRCASRHARNSSETNHAI